MNVGKKLFVHHTEYPGTGNEGVIWTSSQGAGEDVAREIITYLELPVCCNYL